MRHRLPLWPFGELALPLVRRQLQGIFTYRANTLEKIFGAASAD